MRDRILELIEETKIVSIVRGISAENAVSVAKALYDGGVKLIEVTFDQKHPENFSETTVAIASIKKAMGDKMAVGAGTVITLEQLILARDAGAEFIVSPDTDAEIISKTVELGMVSLPGAYTPTEAKLAHNSGADYVKLFPCTDNAISYLKAIKAPLSHIKFLAVGGVSSDNAADFIKAGACGVGMGSSLVNKKWVDDGKFELITQEAKKTVENIKALEDRA